MLDIQISCKNHHPVYNKLKVISDKVIFYSRLRQVGYGNFILFILFSFHPQYKKENKLVYVFLFYLLNET